LRKRGNTSHRPATQLNAVYLCGLRGNGRRRQRRLRISVLRLARIGRASVRACARPGDFLSSRRIKVERNVAVR
jgi:hypothetical protein